MKAMNDLTRGAHLGHQPSSEPTIVIAAERTSEHKNEKPSISLGGYSFIKSRAFDYCYLDQPPDKLFVPVPRILWVLLSYTFGACEIVARVAKLLWCIILQCITASFREVGLCGSAVRSPSREKEGAHNETSDSDGEDDGTTTAKDSHPLFSIVLTQTKRAVQRAAVSVVRGRPVTLLMPVNSAHSCFHGLLGTATTCTKLVPQESIGAFGFSVCRDFYTGIGLAFVLVANSLYLLLCAVGLGSSSGWSSQLDSNALSFGGGLMVSTVLTKDARATTADAAKDSFTCDVRLPSVQHTFSFSAEPSHVFAALLVEKLDYLFPSLELSLADGQTANQRDTENKKDLFPLFGRGSSVRGRGSAEDSIFYASSLASLGRSGTEWLLSPFQPHHHQIIAAAGDDMSVSPATNSFDWGNNSLLLVSGAKDAWAIGHPYQHFGERGPALWLWLSIWAFSLAFSVFGAYALVRLSLSDAGAMSRETMRELIMCGQHRDYPLGHTPENNGGSAAHTILPTSDDSSVGGHEGQTLNDSKTLLVKDANSSGTDLMPQSQSLSSQRGIEEDLESTVCALNSCNIDLERLWWDRTHTGGANKGANRRVSTQKEAVENGRRILSEAWALLPQSQEGLTHHKGWQQAHDKLFSNTPKVNGIPMDCAETSQDTPPPSAFSSRSHIPAHVHKAAREERRIRFASLLGPSAVRNVLLFAARLVAIALLTPLAIAGTVGGVIIGPLVLLLLIVAPYVCFCSLVSVLGEGLGLVKRLLLSREDSRIVKGSRRSQVMGMQRAVDTMNGEVNTAAHGGSGSGEMSSTSAAFKEGSSAPSYDGSDRVVFDMNPPSRPDALLPCFSWVRTPLSVQFCRSCCQYIDGFDHHCGIVGACIGHRNFPLFLLVLCACFISAAIPSLVFGFPQTIGRPILHAMLERGEDRFGERSSVSNGALGCAAMVRYGMMGMMPLNPSSGISNDVTEVSATAASPKSTTTVDEVRQAMREYMYKRFSKPLWLRANGYGWGSPYPHVGEAMVLGYLRENRGILEALRNALLEGKKANNTAKYLSEIARTLLPTEAEQANDDKKVQKKSSDRHLFRTYSYPSFLQAIYDDKIAPEKGLFSRIVLALSSLLHCAKVIVFVTSKETFFPLLTACLQLYGGVYGTLLLFYYGFLLASGRQSVLMRVEESMVAQLKMTREEGRGEKGKYGSEGGREVEEDTTHQQVCDRQLAATQAYFNKVRSSFNATTRLNNERKEKKEAGIQGLAAATVEFLKMWAFYSWWSITQCPLSITDEKHRRIE